MKILIGFILTFFLTSCAHHHNKTKHHHHAYEKQCAYSVSHGDLKTEGFPEHKIEHGGKVYYFSSKDKMNSFKRDIDENIKKADNEWLKNSGPNR